MMTVVSSSMLKLAFPRIFLRGLFISLATRSYAPPRQGDLTKIKRQVIKCSWRNSWILVLLKSFFKIEFYFLNVLALSDKISLGIPLLAINLRKASRNDSTDWSGTTSKCNALETRHENNTIYAFLLELCPLSLT